MDRRRFLQGTLLIAAALQGCHSMEPATSSAAKSLLAGVF